LRRALITGVCGFCGRSLLARLRAEGNLAVFGVDRCKAPPLDLNLQDYLSVDLCDPGQLAGIVRRLKPDFVFNLAGLAQGDAVDIFRTNALGPLYLLEAIRQCSSEARVLLVGSAAEYGPANGKELPLTELHACHPAGPYGVSKHSQTLLGLDYACQYGLRVLVARPFNIVGPGIPPTLVIGAILDRAKQLLTCDQPRVITAGNLNTQRDFIAVEDVVDAYWRMLQGEHWGEVFNICSGRPTTIQAVVERLLSFAEPPLKLAVDPKLMRASDVSVSYGSWEKAHRAFGFKPTTSLDSALRAAWDFAMRENGLCD
jgi:GDP-4-dehydro-6-deoxy-D-mannose reductase